MVLHVACYLCTLYLTARHFTHVLVDSFVLIYKGTLLNSVRLEFVQRRLELDSEIFVQRERLTLDIALYQDYLIVLLFDCRF